MAESLHSLPDFDIVARDLALSATQVAAVVQLLDEGNTPAFITRFRRNETSGLTESKILEVKRRVALLRSLSERKAIILKSIESQGALTEELAQAIQTSSTSKQLEDLYLPWKPRKQSLGQVARQRGLEPLANDIFQGMTPETDLAVQATNYVRIDKGLMSLDDVFKGVGHIIAEKFADDIELRKKFRDAIWKTGQIATKAIAADAGSASTNDSEETDNISVNNSEAAVASSSADSSSQIVPKTMDDEPSGSTDHAPNDGAIQTPGAPEGHSPDPATCRNTQTVSESIPPVVPLADDPVVACASETTKQQQPTEIVAVELEGPNLAERKAPSGQTTAPANKDSAARKNKKRKKPTRQHDPFKDYADFTESLKKLPSHRTLAINRAERAKRIRVRIKMDEQAFDHLVQSLVDSQHPFKEFLNKCASDSVQRLIIPSLEREIRRELTDNAEQHALKVFGRNLRHLLLKPPVRSRRVLAIDPGFRYGCHAATLDEFGNPLGHAVFHVVGNERRRAGGRCKLVDLITAHGCRMIAIGNGSACREAEQLISDIINNELGGQNLEYVIVNEAGTNAYASSETGREELSNFEPAIRSAISIGRRLLDPLSELVKIDPAHLGIGLYQHDIKAKHLAHELDEVVASCVNYVGVDVNRASPALLSYVSGLGKLAARRLFEYRQLQGPFRNRQQFRDVPGFGEQTFTQAAGFLRIVDGDNPLDSTGIHPESYKIAEAILTKVEFAPQDLIPPTKTIEVPPVVAPRSAAEPVEPASSVPAAEAPSTADHASGDSTESATATALPIKPEPETAVVDEQADSSAATITSQDVGAAADATTPTTHSPMSDESTSPGATVAPSGPEPRTVEVIDNQQWQRTRKRLRDALHGLDSNQLASEFGVSSFVLADLIQSLSNIGVDPRERLPSVVFRRGILKIEDIAPEMHFRGQVVNVVDFGVFVDIGLGDSSLIHISRLSDGYVSDPHLMFAVGDTLDVWVAQVDKERRRVTLTAIRPGAKRGGQRGRSPRRAPFRSEKHLADSAKVPSQSASGTGARFQKTRPRNIPPASRTREFANLPNRRRPSHKK